MLISFSCPAYPTITMFGDPAKRLIRLMGHSGSVPGAIMGKDVPVALARLKAGLEKGEPTQAPDDSGDDTEPPVSLSKRAVPLIEMLEAAAEEECEVMWESVN